MSTARTAPSPVRLAPRAIVVDLQRVSAAATLAARSPAVALVPVLGLYLAIWLLLPPGGFYFGDQGVKLLQVEALARSHSLAVGSAQDPASAFDITFAGPYYAQIGDSFQSIYPIAFAAIVAPFYLLLGFRGLVVPSLVGGLMAAYFGGRSAARLRIPLPGVVTLLIGLATPLPFYAETFWEHALAMGLLSLALYLVLSERHYGAGMAVGVALWMRPESLVFAPALILAEVFLTGWRPALRASCFLAAGLLTTALPNVIFNRLVAGSWSGAQVAAANSATGWSRLGPLEFLALRLQLFFYYFTPVGIRKGLVVAGVAAATSLALRVLRRPQGPAAAILYLGAVIAGLAEVLVAWVPAFSVTDAFPLSFAAVIAASSVRDRRVRFLGALALLAAVALLYLIPTGSRTAGGWGPRYLLPLFIPLALLAWFAFWKYPTRTVRGAFLCLMASCIVVQGAGLYRLKVEQERWTGLNAEIRQLQPASFATALWWVPQVAAPTFDHVRWFGVTDRADLDAVEQATDGFWWVWTTETLPGFEPQVWQNSDNVPVEGFQVVEQRALSTRGLHATLFRRSGP